MLSVTVVQGAPVLSVVNAHSWSCWVVMKQGVDEEAYSTVAATCSICSMLQCNSCADMADMISIHSGIMQARQSAWSMCQAISPGRHHPCRLPQLPS